MRHRVLLGALAGATVLGTVVAGGPPVGADGLYNFVGYGGGSLVRAANNTVTSDLTAASEINTVASPLQDTNDAAGVTVRKLLRAQGVSTSTKVESVSGGYRVTTTARTADVNALGGALTAAAIESTSTATIRNGKASVSTSAKFAGLKIAGVRLPLVIPKNYLVQIPGVATVALNYQQAGAQGQKGMAYGIGAYVSLLKPRGANAVGASVSLSPTYAALGPVTKPPSGVFLGGKAYGTQVTADAGSAAHVRSDPTAPVNLQAAGTNGKTVTSSVAGVHLSPTATVGGVTNTRNGTNTASVYDGRMTSKVAGINLLNGLVKATAVSVEARVRGVPGKGNPTVTGSTGLVNLTIAGKKIPVNTSPNTRLKLLNVGTVTLNEQVRKTRSITVRALVIRLSTAAYGFPAGAEIQVAVASASAS